MWGLGFRILGFGCLGLGFRSGGFLAPLALYETPIHIFFVFSVRNPSSLQQDGKSRPPNPGHYQDFPPNVGKQAYLLYAHIILT